MSRRRLRHRTSRCMHEDGQERAKHVQRLGCTAGTRRVHQLATEGVICSFSVQRSRIHTRTAPLGIFIFPHPGEWVGWNFIFSNMSRRPHSNSSPPTAIGRAGREALPPRRGRRRHLRPHRHWFERQALGRAGTETWKSVLVSGSHKRAGSVRFYMRVFFWVCVFLKPFLNWVTNPCHSVK